MISSLLAGDLEREIKLPRYGKVLRVADFTISDGELNLIGTDGGIVLVVPKEKRRQLFDEAHSGSLAGHFAAKKMTPLLKNSVFWEGMDQDISRWVRECRERLLANPRQALVPPLKPFLTSKPFEIVCVDVLEMGLSASGMKYVVVIVDHFSKWVGAYAVPDKAAPTVANVIFQ